MKLLPRCELPRGGGGPCLECSAWLGRESTLEDVLGFLVGDARASGPFSDDGEGVALILEVDGPEVRRLRVDVQVFEPGDTEAELQAWLHPTAVMSSLGLGDWWTSEDPIAWDDDAKPQHQMAAVYRLLGSWWLGACHAAGLTGAVLAYEGWEGTEGLDCAREHNPTALITTPMIANAAGWDSASIEGSLVIVQGDGVDESPES